nr:MAG TPA: hypothetical protein [Bacteriophage sp.]
MAYDVFYFFFRILHVSLRGYSSERLRLFAYSSLLFDVFYP